MSSPPSSALCVLLAAWMQRHSVDPVYTQAPASSGWLIAFVVSMPFTTLKGWPRRTQAAFVGVLLLVVVSLVLGAAWTNSR